MNKPISSKITALTLGVLTVSFLAAFYVVAWQEPTQAPPEGNVPTPLNVGFESQTKEGDLTINGVLKTLQNMIVDLVTIKGDGSISPNLNADKLDDYNAADLMAQAGGKAIYVTKCSWSCSGNAGYNDNAAHCISSCSPPACASGDTSLVTGCAAMGGGISVPSHRFYNGYGYCERVCRDE